jgi:hypothetical protein
LSRRRVFEQFANEFVQIDGLIANLGLIASLGLIANLDLNILQTFARVAHALCLSMSLNQIMIYSSRLYEAMIGQRDALSYISPRGSNCSRNQH